MSKLIKFQLKQIREEFYFYSGKLSEVVRSLSFAGIGIIWILRIPGTEKIPLLLIIPLILFAMSLLFDILQYAIGAILWDTVLKKAELELETEESEKEIENGLINLLTFIAVCIKVVVMVSGYIFVIIYMLKNLF